MLSISSIKEVLRITIWTFIMGILMLLVFFFIKQFDLTVINGMLLGCFYSSFNFLLTAFCVEKSVAKTQNKAIAFMIFGYYFRLILVGVVVLFAIKSPYINLWSAVIPIIFPRIVIIVNAFFNAKKGAKTDERKSSGTENSI